MMNRMTMDIALLPMMSSDSLTTPVNYLIIIIVIIGLNHGQLFHNAFLQVPINLLWATS